ncbi:MAG: hypothetical protein ACFFA6_16960 [Promethearchaeota archaeon]
MELKIDLGRQGNFILAILLTYFLFFGYICNSPGISGKHIEERLVFIYQVLFRPKSIISLIILIIIVFIMVYREKFIEYGIRNSFWLSFIIIVMSFMWYWIIYGFDITIIGKFFTSYEGYLTISSLLSINLLTAMLAGLARKKSDELKKY